MASVVNRKRLVPAAVAIAVILGGLRLTSHAVTPKEPTWDDVVAEAKAGGYFLITAEELRQRLEKDSGEMLLVDTRQEWEYATGHIKGAVNFPIEPTWWSRWWKSRDLAAALGPDKNRFIVFY
jgi:hypothetical protein